jgi:peptidoglycan/xylan/chitin deacetylase (PgdA/CDA1 family)
MLWHEHLRRTAKLLIVGGLHYSGLLGLVRRKHMQDNALILMYHRVFPSGAGVPDYSPNGMAVTPGEFAMQMRFLRRHYDVVPLSQVVAAVRGEQAFPKNMCAVTFDDGWRDVYEYAFPILRQHEIPATIYLTTGFIDETDWFWEERSKYLLALLHEHVRSRRVAREHALAARCQLETFGVAEILSLRPSRLPGYLLERGREMKRWDERRRAGLMEMLESVIRQLVPEAPRPFMNWSEVGEMAQAGIEFENHTVTHAILSELSPSDAEREVRTAAARIREAIGRNSVHLAYPYGKFNEEVRRRLQYCDVRSATTTRQGLVSHGSDPYSLNRVNMCSDIAGWEPLFAARVLGI